MGCRISLSPRVFELRGIRATATCRRVIPAPGSSDANGNANLRSVALWFRLWLAFAASGIWGVWLQDSYFGGDYAAFVRGLWTEHHQSSSAPELAYRWKSSSAACSSTRSDCSPRASNIRFGTITCWGTRAASYKGYLHVNIFIIAISTLWYSKICTAASDCGCRPKWGHARTDSPSKRYWN